jgi:hypothetical protein
MRRIIAAAAATVSFAISTGYARADDLVDIAVISDSSFRAALGSVLVNEAAGNGNLQANVAAVATGSALPLKRVTQQTSATGVGGGYASIQNSAFSGASGLLQINQSAGTGNAQGNAAIVRSGVSLSEMGDDALAAALPNQQTNSTSTRASGVTDTVSASATSFQHSRGIVQVNQCAGAGNSTANGFILQIQKGVTYANH